MTLQLTEKQLRARRRQQRLHQRWLEKRAKSGRLSGTRPGARGVVPETVVVARSPVSGNGSIGGGGVGVGGAGDLLLFPRVTALRRPRRSGRR